MNMSWTFRSLLASSALLVALAGCSPSPSPASSTPAPVASPAGETPTAPASPAAVETPAPSATMTPAASTPDAQAGSASPSPVAAGTPGAAVPAVNGVKILVHKPGSGASIASGQAGRFHYTGWLESFESDKKFDSSVDRGEPFAVELGAGRVIPGWDQGLVGMQPGEIRRLEIAPEMAYGPDGMPPVIPPNSTLFFEVEYLGPAQ